jgi:hypothetical protein
MLSAKTAALCEIQNTLRTGWAVRLFLGDAFVNSITPTRRKS